MERWSDPSPPFAYPPRVLVDVHERRTRWFVLQWHLTQACDLRCRHCYDRSSRSVLRLPDALRVLDDLEHFCASRGVRPKLTLSGGNPFFYPWFFELWEAAAARDIPVALLGNPVSNTDLDRLVAIRRPESFQVSLEGLREHTDHIRGPGAYDRVMAFLPELRERGIRSAVMMTLTAANLEQVIPLGRALNGLADRFTWNRLSQVGEGATLLQPSPKRYRAFLDEYLEASRELPVLHLKDNLLNLTLALEGEDPARGCTGFGCGAAFNFVALLPDGEAHACRKLPSPLGNVLEEGLAAIYDAPRAKRFRQGSRACEGCGIRARCGGCPAVSFGAGLDPMVDRDPFCFARKARA